METCKVFSLGTAPNKKADELQITGFVKNKKNGTVEAAAQGRDEAVNEFVSWLYEGPSGARVTRVEMKKPVSDSFETFEIR